jgi:hypothetical protein
LAQAVMDAVMATMINTTRRIFNPVAAFRIMFPPFCTRHYYLGMFRVLSVFTIPPCPVKDCPL